MKIACALCAAFILCGCENHHSRSCQRFIPVGNIADKSGQNSTATVPRAAALALDTKTGSLCVTYQYKVDVDYPEWKELPTCKSLYEKYSE